MRLLADHRRLGLSSCFCLIGQANAAPVIQRPGQGGAGGRRPPVYILGDPFEKFALRGWEGGLIQSYKAACPSRLKTDLETGKTAVACVEKRQRDCPYTARKL